VQLVPSRGTLPYLPDAQLLYVLADLTAPDVAGASTATGLPLNLSLLVDRSTSMKGGRLTQVKLAVNRLIDSLAEMDTLSIVTFSDRAEIVLPSQRPVNKIEAKGKINAIHAGGGTEIFRGLMYGLAELYKGRDIQGINHLILLTDGRTYGDEEDCLALATEAAPDGIAVSALGIGHEFNDEFLDRLAGTTGGASAHVENEEQVVRFLDEHVRALDSAWAHDLGLTVRTQPGVELKALFKLKPNPQLLTVDHEVYHLGTMAPGQRLSLLLELVVQPRAEGYHHLFDVDVSGRVRGAAIQMTVDLAAPFLSEPPEERPPQRIIAVLSQVSLYRMHARSLEDVERGETGRATRRLQALAGWLDELGEDGLATTALGEADRLRRGAALSEEGRKRLKYGTRALMATKLIERPGTAGDTRKSTSAGRRAGDGAGSDAG
jgi:Ca-activated chloride channel family protein